MGLQRVVSFSILCDLYLNEANGTNPFLPFFLEAIEKGTDPVERQYLVHLLCSPPTKRNVSAAACNTVVGNKVEVCLVLAVSADFHFFLTFT